MAKKKNKNKQNNIKNEVAKQNTSLETNFKDKRSVSTYFAKLNDSLADIKETLNNKTLNKNNTEAYLRTDHRLYESIKNNAFSIQKQLFDYTLQDTDKENKVEKIFFDFENNLYLSNEIQTMPKCYSSDSGNIHICKENGLYIDNELYASSRLFLTDKKFINSNSNYINSFRKILDFIVTNKETDKKYPYFCMLPESIDIFNTKIRDCLNTFKGKIISIPKSVAVTYYVLDKLHYGDRYCIVDLDGLHPVVTQLSIGIDENSNKVILREGFIRNHNIKYSYLNFANEYVSMFEKKYSVLFNEREKKTLIDNKIILKVFNNKELVSLFRKDGKIDVIFDENIYSECIKKYSTKNISFKNCNMIYIVSTQCGLVSGNGVIQLDNSASFNGLQIIRDKLLQDENSIIWKERLPKISLEVIDESVGRFKVIDLINENNEGQNIRLSIDEEIELPFKGTITLQKGKNDYYLPLEREIYSEDVNSDKEAHFTDKSFPLDRDIPVDLVVKYNYMSESPIKLYARPKVKVSEFQELANTWVDPHEIKIYSGIIFNGYCKEINELKNKYVFINTCRNFDTFLNGEARFTKDKWVSDPIDTKYHSNYYRFFSNYKQIRSLFDSENVKEDEFKRLYNDYKVDTFFEKYVELLQKAPLTDYNTKYVSLYLYGIKKCVSDFVVACWYYDKENESIKKIYKYLANQKEIEILSKLSRCIIEPKDDVYDVFDNLSNQVYAEILNCKNSGINFATKYQEKISFVRSLSSNCWFNKNWIFNFYNSSKGKECIYEIINFTYDFLIGDDYGDSKRFRDILEFLVCISRLREYDHNILNPNDKKTKEMLHILKNSYVKVEQMLGERNLASRLVTNVNQGLLFGYPNYIYMLIITLSGEGQVDLVGYHDR